MGESREQKRHFGIGLVLLLAIFQSLYYCILPFLDSFFDLPTIMIPSRHDFRVTEKGGESLLPTSDNNDASLPNHDITTIYCPGAGFSGFWYLFGKLKAWQQIGILDQEIPNPHYFCFSAGCLGVVASILEKSLPQVFNAAINARNSWRNGDITRYDIVPSFIDKLLEIEDREEELRNIMYTNTTSYDYDSSLREKLAKIHIITTERGVLSDNNTILGLKYVARTPSNLVDLKELLIQTTWIPYVTGNAIWRKTGDKLNMDGAFTANIHPKFDVNLRLPLRRDLVFNALNPNMERKKAELFFDLGFKSIGKQLV